MLNTRHFGMQLKNLGFDFYSGVPCSFLKSLINYAINDCDYIAAANEGDAVATCAGAYLGGKKPVFLCQNSGLSNAMSPLISLNHPFQIPILGFVSLRGDIELNDEPQHALMGRITTKLLDEMEIPWQYLSSDSETAAQQIQHANEMITQQQSFFFIIKKNTFSEVTLNEQLVKPIGNYTHQAKTQNIESMLRHEILHALSTNSDSDTALLATTGYTGRELYELNDSPQNFYMVGSMGCINAIGLGLALAKPNKKIVAIDGDGALLMRMGNMATIAHYRPPNLFHILLDNGQHESTGNQNTVSQHIDFSHIAANMQYPKAIFAHNLAEVTTLYNEWLKSPELTFVHVKTTPGVLSPLGRPSIQPDEVAQRLKDYLR